MGTGEDLTIAELAELIRDVVGFRGRITFDPSKPDGTPRKLLDVSRLFSLSWRPRIPLRQGPEQTYRWFVEHVARGFGRERHLPVSGAGLQRHLPGPRLAGVGTP